MSTSRYVVAALALSLVMSGCGSASGVKSGPAPVSTGQGGWKVYAPGGGDYRMALPADWITLDAQSFVERMSSHGLNAELKAQIKGLRATATQPGTLVALDHSSTGNAVLRRYHFAPNVLLRRVETGLTLPDSKILSEAANTLQQSTAKLPGLKESAIRHGAMDHIPAESRAYTFDEELPSGTAIRVTERDEFMVDDGTLYLLSCTSTAGDYPRVDSLCDHAVSTFVVTG